jgi:hypothetical protein
LNTSTCPAHIKIKKNHSTSLNIMVRRDRRATLTSS